MTGPVRTVVCADDDADILELVRIAITRAGLELIATAGDGATALEAIRSGRPDLAILDISMPELNGLDVARAVRADESLASTQIVMLSASVAAKTEAMEAGADYFLGKPFSPRELTAWLTGLGAS